mgnify:FL=1
MKKLISFPSSRGQRSPMRTVIGTAVLLALLALGNTGASAALSGNRYTTSEITLDNWHQFSSSLYNSLITPHDKNTPAVGQVLTVTGEGIREEPTRSWYVMGGYSTTDDVLNNQLNVNGSINRATLYGGYADGTGTASGNTLTLNTQSTVSFGQLGGGYSASGNVLNNTVVITASSQVVLNDQVAQGARTRGTDVVVTGNSVVVEENASFDPGPRTAQALYGAYAQNGASDAKQNSVVIRHGALVAGDVFGVFILGGSQDTPSVAENNTVSIVGGRVDGDVRAVDVSGNLQKLKSYQGNSVVLTDATVTGNISVVNPTRYDLSEEPDTNKLVLHNSTIDGNISVSKVHSSVDPTSVGRGTIEASGRNTVGGSVRYFERLVLTVGTDNETVDDAHENAVLTMTDTGAVLDLQERELVLTGEDSTLFSDSYDLITGASLAIDNTTTIVKEGTFTDALWSFEELSENSDPYADGLQIVRGDLMSGDELITKGTLSANANSKTLAESFLGSIAFLNQGAEFIADEGMRAIVNAARSGQTATFGAVHGGSSRYETGSSVDVDGVTLATGVATKFGNLTAAGFIEAGWASSESHVHGTEADGDHDYYGVGVAVRYEFQNPFYLDGSVRLGMASTEFDGRYGDASARYDADSFYGTMHVGAGYLMSITEALKLDLYGRYVLSYLDGDDVGLHTGNGETFSMDSTVTHAFRLGARLNGNFCDNAAWRFGLAYEHVADGDAESDVLAEGTRAALDVPTLEGDTGIMELGVTMTPSATSPWFFDVGLKGYVGDRRGVSGSALVTYAF